MKMGPKTLRFAASLGLVVLALAALAWTGIVTPKAIATAVASPRLALAALAVILLGAQLSVVRWYLLLAWQGYRLRYWEVWRVSYISWFLGAFLPGVAGTDILRTIYLFKDGSDRRAASFDSVLLDRLFGLAALLILALILLLARSETGLPVILRASVCVFLAGTLLAIFAAPFAALWFKNVLLRLLHGHHRLSRLVLELEKAASLTNTAWHQEPGKLFVCLGLGVLGHVFVMAAIVLTAVGAGATALSLPDLALAGTLAVLLNQLPLTPGGIGIGEAGFAQLCLLMAPHSNPALYGSVMLVFRAMTLLSYAPGAVALMVAPPSEKPR